MHNGESVLHGKWSERGVTSNKKPAPHLKEEFFNEHLPYEISMLRAAYDLARANRPASEHNALVDSFLMHARNLIEFFKDRPGCDFDPRMFTNASYQLNRDFIADQLSARINAHVSHLTTRRISQAADELGMTDRGVRTAITSGRLTAEREADRWRISRENFEHFRAALRAS